MKSSIFSNLFAVISLTSVAFIPSVVLAQEDFDFPIDDQARHLQNLENRSADQWEFSDSNPRNLESYSFTESSQEFRIVGGKPHEWGNTGDSPNSSVLIDVYDFTPDEL